MPNITIPALTPATLNAAQASVGLITGVGGQTGGYTASTFWAIATGNDLGAFSASQIPTEKFDIDPDGTSTEVTTDASFWAGRTWAEFGPGDVKAMAKFESTWRADAPFFPPNLLINYLYAWLFYYVNPLLLDVPAAFGTMRNCAIFAALMKKNTLSTDRKSGITKWSVELQVSGPILYRADDGSARGF